MVQVKMRKLLSGEHNLRYTKYRFKRIIKRIL